jgi:polyribonucleotide nucleotidyltransferase
MGVARVALNRKSLMLNPGSRESALSDGSALVAGSELGVLALEAEGADLQDQDILDGVIYAQRKLQVAIEAIDHFATRASVKEAVWHNEKRDPLLEERIAATVSRDMQRFLEVSTVLVQEDGSRQRTEQWAEQVMNTYPDQYPINQVKKAVEQYFAATRRQRLLCEPRPASRPGLSLSNEGQNIRLPTESSDSRLVRTELAYIAAGASVAVLECVTAEERSVCDMVCEIVGSEIGVNRFSARMRTNGISLTFLQMALHKASRIRAQLLRQENAAA